MMTAFGIYFVILYILSICATAYYVAQGEGNYNSHGVLVFTLLWSILNLAGILIWGTGLGL